MQSKNQIILKYTLLWFGFFAHFALLAQCTQYKRLIREAREADSLGKYSIAVDKLRFALLDCPTYTSDVFKMLDQTIEKIEKQRQVAINDRAKAEKEKTEAEAARKLADDRLAQINRQINVSRANGLAMQSVFLADQNLNKALKIAEQAYLMAQTVETYQALTNASYKLLGNDAFLYQQVPRNSKIQAAAFSPDQKILAVGFANHSMQLWDVSGKLRKTLPAFSSGVQRITFSGDSKFFVSTSINNISILWDAEGNLIASLKGHTAMVKTCVWAKQCRHFLTLSSDGIARLWNVRGELIAILEGHSRAITDAEFSTNNQWILTASEDNSVRLWDITGKLVRVIRGHTEAVVKVAFSPDNKYFLTGSNDRSAKLWNPDGAALATLVHHNGSITSLAFSADGRYILTTGKDSSAVLWNLKGEKMAILNRHSDEITTARFSPKEPILLTASADHTAKLWDYSGKLIADLNLHRAPIKSANFSDDGKTIITIGNDYTVKCWTSTGKFLYDQNRHSATILAVEGYPGQIYSFSEDGMFITPQLKDALVPPPLIHEKEVVSGEFHATLGVLMTFTQDQQIYFWDLKGKLLRTSPLLEERITKIISSKTGFIAASKNGKLMVWSAKGELQHSFQVATKPIHRIELSADGKLILACSEDGRASLWDFAGNKIANISHEASNLNALFSPKGQSILTYAGSQARLWNMKGELIKVFPFKQNINDAQFTPDGFAFIACLNDNSAVIWSIEGKLLSTIKHTTPVYFARFAPDGKTVATVGSDSAVVLSKLDGTRLARLKAHMGHVFEVQFFPDGARLATVSSDKTVKIWSLDGNVLANLDQHREGVLFMGIASDGTKVYTVSRDGRAFIWNQPVLLLNALKSLEIPGLTEIEKKNFHSFLNLMN